jgi:hypothetical protein
MEESEEVQGIDVSYFGNLTLTWDIPETEVMYYYIENYG